MKPRKRRTRDTHVGMDNVRYRVSRWVQGHLSGWVVEARTDEGTWLPCSTVFMTVEQATDHMKDF